VNNDETVKISQILATLREGGNDWREITWRFKDGRVLCHIRVKPHDNQLKFAVGG